MAVRSNVYWGLCNVAYIKQDNNYDVTLCISPQVAHVGNADRRPKW